MVYSTRSATRALHKTSCLEPVKSPSYVCQCTSPPRNEPLPLVCTTPIICTPRSQLAENDTETDEDDVDPCVAPTPAVQPTPLLQLLSVAAAEVLPAPEAQKVPTPEVLPIEVPAPEVLPTEVPAPTKGAVLEGGPELALSSDEDIIAWMDRMKRAKLLKNRDLAKHVGLSTNVIRDKLSEHTLDSVHRRKVLEYVRGIVNLGNDLAAAMDQRFAAAMHRRLTQSPAGLQQAAGEAQLVGSRRARPVAQGTGDQHPCQPGPTRDGQEDPSAAGVLSPLAKRGRPRCVPQACPLMAMGYSGLECTEMVQGQGQLVQHVACHVATLWKRLEELEVQVQDLRSIAMCAQERGGGGLAAVVQVE